MEWFQQTITAIGQQLLIVLCYPILPTERIFFLYLLSSLVFAIGVYLASPSFRIDRRNNRGFVRGLLSFLFPRHVWSHPSAWVDVRYFIPHQMVRLWLYTDFLVVCAVLAQQGVVSGLRFGTGVSAAWSFSGEQIYLVVLYTFVSLVLLDFTAFFMHFLQHKIPVLWEFHKVHHSAEVLHPLSNYREHPMDNVAYAMSGGVALGVVNGAFVFIFGVQPAELLTPLLGIGVVAFSFNILAYHLRHSHIWLRWPGFLGCVYGCPAHHQIHHSCKPHHIDKNFSFQLPVWDLLFGTFHLPHEPEELEIGLGDGTEHEYRSFFTIYTLPFVKVFRRLTGSAPPDDHLSHPDSNNDET